MLMKKIGALFMLALFVISMVPFAAAESIAAPNIYSVKEKKLAKLDQAKLAKVESWKKEKISELPRSQIAEISAVQDLDAVDLGALAKKKEQMIEAGLTVRPIAKAKLLKANEDFTIAKKKYVSSKENLLSAKQKFLIAKQKLSTCEGESCLGYNKEIILHTKDYLSNLADMLEKALDKAKGKVEASEQLSDEEEQALLSQLADVRTSLAKIRAKIDQIGPETTKAEVQEIVSVAKVELGKVKEFIKKVSVMLLKEKIESILAKSYILEEKLEKVLEEMEEKGLPVEKTELLVDEFSQHIFEARSHYKLAMDALTTDKAAARKHFIAAKDELQDAYKVLKQITKLVNQAEGVQIVSANTPKYVPGKTLGFAAWRDDDKLHVCVSGDGKKHTSQATILGGEFFAVKAYHWETSDLYKHSKNVLKFETKFGKNQDCIAFKTTGDAIGLDLKIDGEPADIYFRSKVVKSPTRMKGTASLGGGLITVKPMPLPEQDAPIALPSIEVDDIVEQTKGFVLSEEDVSLFSELILTNRLNRLAIYDLNNDRQVNVADVVTLRNMVDFFDAYLVKDGQLDSSDVKVFMDAITALGNTNIGGSYFDMNKDGIWDVLDLVLFRNFIKDFDFTSKEVAKSITKPAVCTKIYKPVCGVDGQTYSNSCFAKQEGAKIAYGGACQSDSIRAITKEDLAEKPLDLPESDAPTVTGGGSSGGAVALPSAR